MFFSSAVSEMKWFVIFLALACLLGAKASYLSPEKQQQIDEIVEAVFGCRDIVGTGISVIKNGETIFSKGYGLIDRERGDTVTPETLFSIASVSKQFVATLLGMLLEEHG